MTRTHQTRRRFGKMTGGAAGALALGTVAAPVAHGQAGARLLNGAGATFPAVLYSKWSTEYNKLTGVQINYQAIGSGGGIQAHQNMTADFGATDGPMTEKQLTDAKGGPTLHVPMALGAVVPTYNLPQIGNTRLRFSPTTLPDIFLGKIKKWNDPAIVADNPGVSLPNEDIIVVHRSDGSGRRTSGWTTFPA